MRRLARYQPQPPREILAPRVALSTTGTDAMQTQVSTPEFTGIPSPKGLPGGHIQNYTRAYRRFPLELFGDTMLPETYHQRVDRSTAVFLMSLSTQMRDEEVLRTLIMTSYPHLGTAGSLQRLTDTILLSIYQQMTSPSAMPTTTSAVGQLSQSFLKEAYRISGPQKDET